MCFAANPLARGLVHETVARATGSEEPRLLVARPLDLLLGRSQLCVPLRLGRRGRLGRDGFGPRWFATGGAECIEACEDTYDHNGSDEYGF
jgi:hypothetical protein